MSPAFAAETERVGAALRAKFPEQFAESERANKASLARKAMREAAEKAERRAWWKAATVEGVRFTVSDDFNHKITISTSQGSVSTTISRGRCEDCGKRGDLWGGRKCTQCLVKLSTKPSTRWRP